MYNVDAVGSTDLTCSLYFMSGVGILEIVSLEKIFGWTVVVAQCVMMGYYIHVGTLVRLMAFTCFPRTDIDNFF